MVFLIILGGFAGFVALIIFSSLLRGYALSVLWGWFMVPTLHLPPLGVVQAIGIAMVVSFLTHQDHSQLQKKERSTGEMVVWVVIYATLYPLLILLIGSVVHRYM